MSSHAYVKAELKCPFCGAVVDDRNDLIGFQWGYCSRYPWPEDVYQVGDTIRWRACEDGSIRAWVYFADSVLGGGNIGDPVVRNLIARDASTYGHPYWYAQRCSVCEQPFKGGAVEIRDGRIERVWLCKPGELIDEVPGNSLDPSFVEVADGAIGLTWGVDTYLIEPGGTLKPMPEWNEHPMQIVNSHCEPQEDF